MDLGENKTVHTPEQVAITYRLAGVGTRFVAILLDSLVHGILLLLLFLLLMALSGGFAVFSGEEEYSNWVVGLWIAGVLLVLFCAFWGYFVIFELVWNGQTPGKRVCGIRVMRDGGFPIDFRASFIRNVVRLVDAFPSFYGVGAFCAFLSKDSKRLGDYAAGTIVVTDARPQDLRGGVAAAQPPPAPDYQVLGDPTLLNLRAITREQFAVVEHFLARWSQLPAHVRADLAHQIATPLISLIGFREPEPGFPYDRFLVELAIAYRNTVGT